MGTTSTLAALSAGVVLGVFISQQYAVPDLKEGVDWLVSECSTMRAGPWPTDTPLPLARTPQSKQVKKVEKMYKKPSKEE